MRTFDQMPCVCLLASLVVGLACRDAIPETGMPECRIDPAQPEPNGASGPGVWHVAAPTSTPRAQAGLFLLPSGHALVVGGHELAGYDHLTSELYDPEVDAWTGGPSPSASRGPSVQTCSGAVMIAGGSGDGETLRTTEILDPNRLVWTETGPLGVARTSQAMVALDADRVLAVGGIDWFAGDDGSGVVFDSVEIYDAASGSWSMTGSLNEARSFAPAVRLQDGRVLTAGGFDSGGSGIDALASSEIYDPQTQTWSFTGSLNQGRDSPMVLLPDGRVLMYAGRTGYRAPGDVDEQLQSAEIFDPNTETWTVIEPIPLETAGPAVTLRDGRLLMTGGVLGGLPNNEPADTVLEFDPGSESWTVLPSMARGRHGHSAIELEDGDVLVVGGWFGGVLGADVDCERYSTD